jgi:hypothetical protein
MGHVSDALDLLKTYRLLPGIITLKELVCMPGDQFVRPAFFCELRTRGVLMPDEIPVNLYQLFHIEKLVFHHLSEDVHDIRVLKLFL